MWRGYRVRRSIKKKAIIEARRRIIAANRAAKESSKLINRLPSMLDALLQARYLSTVGDILKSFGMFLFVQMCIEGRGGEREGAEGGGKGWSEERGGEREGAEGGGKGWSEEERDRGREGAERRGNWCGLWSNDPCMCGFMWREVIVN